MHVPEVLCALRFRLALVTVIPDRLGRQPLGGFCTSILCDQDCDYKRPENNLQTHRAPI